MSSVTTSEAQMRFLVLIFLVLLFPASAFAGPLEDGKAALIHGDYKKAIELLQPLANQGNPEAELAVGELYLIGKGVATDDAKAKQWFQKALTDFKLLAEHGNSSAANSIGYMYLGVLPHDNVEAFKWFRKSAEAGNAEGQDSLGNMYFRGEGVAQDDTEAIKWWRKAANQGNSDAETNIGWAYKNGKGVAQDSEEASKWFHKATDNLEYVNAFSNTSSVVLYSLGDQKTNDTFHGVPVLGKIELRGDEAKSVITEIRSGITGRGGISLCFEPHHGLRVSAFGHVYDYLICYTCLGLEVFKDDKNLSEQIISGSPDVINEILTKYHIPISPQATTDYIKKDREGEEDRFRLDEANEKKWQSAMPTSLRPLWTNENIDVAMAFENFPDKRRAAYKPFHDALDKEFPDQKQQIRTLLKWYGSGAGPWCSGFPGYEMTAGALLSDYPIDKIVNVIENSDLSDEETEGAARYLASCYYQPKPAEWSRLLSPIKKKLLLEHTLKKSDPENSKNAKSAFAELEIPALTIDH